MPDKYADLPDTWSFRNYPLNSVQPSPHDPRDFPPLGAGEPLLELPPVFEIEALPILNQGGKGACACFGLLRILVRAWRNAGIVTDLDLSEDYLYARAREIHNWLCQDTGSVPRDICDLLLKEGCPAEVERPYNDQDLCTGTSEAERAAGAAWRTTEYRACHTLDDVKQALYRHRTGVTLCLHLFDSFYEIRSDGDVPWPRGTTAGAHLMTIVGWNDHRRRLKVENWWTRRFGDRGYCYVSYDHFNLPPDRGGAWPDDLWTLVVRPQQDQQEEHEEPQPMDGFAEAKQQAQALARHWADAYENSAEGEADAWVAVQFSYAAVALNWLADLIESEVQPRAAAAAPRIPPPFPKLEAADAREIEEGLIAATQAFRPTLISHKRD